MKFGIRTPSLRKSFAARTSPKRITPADLFHGPPGKLPPLALINRRHARVETRASHQTDEQGVAATAGEKLAPKLGTC